MLKAPVLIEGVRLRLRRSSPDDAAAVFLAAHDAEVMRFMDWPAHRSEADARSYLEGCVARWELGSEYHWVIEAKPGREMLGAIACRVREHAADFGYFVARDRWGQGLATEAAGLLVSWLRRQGSIVRIWATTDDDNRASARVLQKLELKLEGVMRKATRRPNIGGAPRDTALYAWTRDDSGRNSP